MSFVINNIILNKSFSSSFNSKTDAQVFLYGVQRNLNYICYDLDWKINNPGNKVSAITFAEELSSNWKQDIHILTNPENYSIVAA